MLEEPHITIIIYSSSQINDENFKDYVPAGRHTTRIKAHAIGGGLIINNNSKWIWTLIHSLIFHPIKTTTHKNDNPDRH